MTLIFRLICLLLNKEGRKYLFAPMNKNIGKIKVFICRLRGHKNVIWFNPNGFEPDMRCKNCLDDIG